ncbi:GHMP kinase [Muricauda sp. CAU 1633]|uniref:GYDIA family GHMP kinase n=1 Tax=Allomuricauda sp. CAU 1633 TaxID=2816036 RepID=UPI001A8F7907|nr:GYDIA family GHMP kinase [Muricauda sp. CAU 1633]MBO0321449.1 GHMP kinase [Muricauda sp. CAU 1633]
MHKEFYSNGKLLLSGEYAILDGALGLAVPTTLGQSLQVVDSDSGTLRWASFDENAEIWFQAEFELESFRIKTASDEKTAQTLVELLIEARQQNPDFLSKNSGVEVETRLGFPRSWGLGTSSTLINNIAQWAQVDAYQLLWNAFGGSGYDIACAQHSAPITYQVQNGKPAVNEVDFDPLFKESLYFVHLNQKQSSKEAIAAYRKQEFNQKDLIHDISSLTEKMVNAATLQEFQSLMEQHEAILSNVLQIPTVKSQLFSDYPGALKSLGAWGGDFVLAAGNQHTLDYFSAKGYPTVIPFSKMVL